MQETENYKLKKPDKKEFYDIGIFNDNADVIDRELANIRKTVGNDLNETLKGISEKIENLGTKMDFGGNAKAEDVLEGKTFTNDDGKQVGNLKYPKLAVPIPKFIIQTGYIDIECDSLESLFIGFKLNEGEWQKSTSFKNLQPTKKYVLYAKDGNSKVYSKEIITPKAKASISLPILEKKTGNSLKIKTVDGAKIKYNNKLYNSPLELNDLDLGEEIRVCSVKEETSTLLGVSSDYISFTTDKEMILFDGSGNSPWDKIDGWQLRSDTNQSDGDLKVSGAIRIDFHYTPYLYRLTLKRKEKPKFSKKISFEITISSISVRNVDECLIFGKDFYTSGVKIVDSLTDALVYIKACQKSGHVEISKIKAFVS